MQTKRMGARPVYNNDSNNTQFTYASKCVCVCVAPAVRSALGTEGFF
jgi:hypothetical protein